MDKDVIARAVRTTVFKQVGIADRLHERGPYCNIRFGPEDYIVVDVTNDYMIDVVISVMELINGHFQKYWANMRFDMADPNALDNMAGLIWYHYAMYCEALSEITWRQSQALA